jgi:hypothetical protein
MVSSLVDYAIHRITVFEGKAETKSQLRSWMESRGAINQVPRRSTRANSNASDSVGIGGTDSHTSSPSKAKSSTTLFILFDVASQITLLPETGNHFKQIFVHN